MGENLRHPSHVQQKALRLNSPFNIKRCHPAVEISLIEDNNIQSGTN